MTWCQRKFVQVLFLLGGLSTLAFGQFVQRPIGGVLVDSNGVIRSVTESEADATVARLRKQLEQPAADLVAATDLRMVSLRGLNEQLETIAQSGGEIPEDVRYLAGLTRVEYVFVYPEQNDIVIAGPAEGWTVGPKGIVVGAESGQATLLLEDLLVAFRTADSAAEIGITCSIEPTAEGRRAYRKFLSRYKQFHPSMIKGIERSLGQQKILLTGIPKSSHYASVLAASDYQMKRFAMRLEPSPIDGMPSFLDLMKQTNGRMSSLTPRWWMACDYDSLARTNDGLAWQIRGQGVMVMTENDLIGADGSVKPTGTTNVVAQRWADTMTEKYQELSRAEPIFGQLRNIMDLSVVAALMEREEMVERSGCDLSTLLDSQNSVGLNSWNVPSAVATQGSFLKIGREYLITASGGVEVNSWSVAANSKVDESVEQQRQTATPKAEDSWRWN